VDDVIAYDAVPWKFLSIVVSNTTLPVIVNDPDNVISYSWIPVKASTD
jgi:hypothetical protein